MKPCSAESIGKDNIDIIGLLFTHGFDATLSFLCTLFVFSVD